MAKGDTSQGGGAIQRPPMQQMQQSPAAPEGMPQPGIAPSKLPMNAMGNIAPVSNTGMNPGMAMRGPGSMPPQNNDPAVNMGNMASIGAGLGQQLGNLGIAAPPQNGMAPDQNQFMQMMQQQMRNRPQFM